MAFIRSGIPGQETQVAAGNSPDILADIRTAIGTPIRRRTVRIGDIDPELMVVQIRFGQGRRIHFQIEVQILLIGRSLHLPDGGIGATGVGGSVDGVPVDVIIRHEGRFNGTDVQRRENGDPVLGNDDIVDLGIAVQRIGFLVIRIFQREVVPCPDGASGIRHIETDAAVTLDIGIIGDTALRRGFGFRGAPSDLGRITVQAERERAAELAGGGGKEGKLHMRTPHMAEGELGGAGQVGEGVLFLFISPGEHGNGAFPVAAGSGSEVPLQRDIEADGVRAVVNMAVTGGIQGHPGSVQGAENGIAFHRGGEGGDSGGCIRRKRLPEVPLSVVAEDRDLVPGIPGERFFISIGRPGFSGRPGLDGKYLEAYGDKVVRLLLLPAGNHKKGRDRGPDNDCSIHR